MSISVRRIVLAVLLIVVGFLVAIISLEEWKVAKELVPSLATLLAAFFGAWFAYLLQIKEKRESKKKEIVSAANQVLFSLFQRVNSLKLFQIDYIDPFRDNPGIHIAMQPILSMQEKVIEFDINKLDFLLGTEHRQIVFDLYIEDRRYETAVKVIEHRSRLHLHEIQPLIHAAGIEEGKDYPESDYKGAIGEMLYAQLKQSTDYVVYNVDRTVSSSIEAKNKLLKVLKEQYPSETFTDFVLLEDNT